MTENDDGWFDKLIQEVEELFAAKRTRRENPYVLHLIKVLWPYGTRGLRRVDVIFRMWQLREPTKLNMPKKFEEAVQSAFNRHSSQSLQFKLPPEDDLFYSVGGKRSGVWGLHASKVETWLKKKKLAPL